MSSRLYPGFGSGKGTYEGHFEARSFASIGMYYLRKSYIYILVKNIYKYLNFSSTVTKFQFD